MNILNAFFLGLGMVYVAPTIVAISDLISTVQGLGQPEPEPYPPPIGELQSQVSGSSLFWALLALVLYAMAQHSIVGRWLSGDTFDTFLWPHRSSPIICIADTAVDVYEMVTARQSGQRQQQNREGRPSDGSGDHDGHSGDRKYAAFLLKLAIFLVGILPQAIQIFSMRGIMYAQSLAAIFFVSSLWGLIRSSPIFSGQGKREHEKLVFEWSTFQQESAPAYLEASVNVVYQIVLHHSMVVLGAWRVIGHAIVIQTSEPLQQIIFWIQTACPYISGLIVTAAIIRRPAQTAPSIGRTKTFVLAFIPWLLTSTLAFFLPVSKKSQSDGIPLLLICAAVCFGFAWALGRSMSWMHSYAIIGSRGVTSQAATASRAPEDERYQRLRQSTITRQSQATDGDIGMQPLNSGRPDTGANSAARTSTQAATQSGADVEALSPEVPTAQRTDSEESQAQGQQCTEFGRIFHIFTRFLKDLASVPQRLCMGVTEVYIYAPGLFVIQIFLKYKVEAWVAFTMLNLGTAAIYYFWIFDGDGTWTPKWSQVLG